MKSDQKVSPKRRVGLTLLTLGLLAGGGVAVGWASTGAPLGLFQAWLAPESRVAPYRLPLQPPASLESEIAFYQERLRRDPDGFLDLVSLADAYVRRARASGEASWYLLAEQAARRSLSLMPQDNPGARLVLARIATARHDFKGALRLTDEILEAHPNNAGAIGTAVTAHLALGELTDAARLAEQLVQMGPSTGTLSQRGLVRAAQGRDAEAAADFAAAIAREQAGETEASAMARVWLGRLYFQRGELASARDLFSEALRIRPEHPLALSLLARLEARADHPAEAERHYRAAYARLRDPADMLGLARLKTHTGATEEAAKLYAMAESELRRSLKAGEFGHRRDMARLLLERARPADLPEALALTTAELAQRQDAETLTVHAWALGRAERWDEARAVAKRALDRGTRDPELLYRAAWIEQGLKAPEQARALARRAEQTDPTFRRDPLYALLVRDGLSVSPEEKP